MRNFKIKNILRAVFLILSFTGCSGSSGIFPEIVTSVSESELVIPNPISIVVDQVNEHIVVANSNVDIFYNTGSLAVLDMDATDTNAPVLSAVDVISTPNFAGQINFAAGPSTLTIPFRESFPSDDSLDQVAQYNLSASGQLTELATSSVSANPFGIDFSGTNYFVVSDNLLTIFDTGLTQTATIDLTTAETAGIDDSDAHFVESVAYDAAGNRLFVSNIGGRLFIIDLATNTLAQVLTGPTSTRSLIINNNTLYALDTIEEAVWIFDLTQLTAPSSTPSTIDDSTFVTTLVGVGNNPNGMALDATNNRLYVTNTDDSTISVIDTLTFRETARVSVAAEDISANFSRDANHPYALALGTFNGTVFLFVTGFEANSVAVINTSTLNVVEVFPNNTL